MKYILKLTFILVFFSAGCTKYLDAVPDRSLTVPTTVSDYQALLENEIMFTNSPALGEFGSDDLYLPDALWATQQIGFRDGYRWLKDLNEGGSSPSWNYAYNKIYYANIVLDGVGKLQNGQVAGDVAILRGWALFCRANAHYDLQEIFGQPYKPASVTTDLGIPLKLNTDLQERVKRATVEVTFHQILRDLNEAVELLPAEVSKLNRNRPCKAAAYALLSRVYLVMQNYNKALECAGKSLDLYNVLVDYNTLDAASRAPFSPLINEVIYNAIQLTYSNRYWQVDLQLYQSYKANDLRKNLFFTADPVTNSGVFKGYYTAALNAFDGMATDEVYLIKAECEARAGNGVMALEDLNTVLLKRFKTGTYVPYSMDNVSDVLTLILTEKRKECVFRNIRWSDLRRLNQEPRFAKTLIRIINGIRYELPPNDPRYVMPIPDDQVRTSGLQQNIK